MELTKCLPCSTFQGRKLDTGTCQLLWQLFECALLGGGCVTALVCTDTTKQADSSRAISVSSNVEKKQNQTDKKMKTIKIRHV